MAVSCPASCGSSSRRASGSARAACSAGSVTSSRPTWPTLMPATTAYESDAYVKKGVDKRAMAVLSAGHLFTDVNQGAVAALIPFLVAERGLSLAAAGTLVLAATLSSSIVQPLFGFFSDRTPLPALMPLGVVLGGLGIALAGVAPSYPLIFLCIVLSGLGVAAFHPESARFANYVSGSRRARGMSFFSIGGNAGFALGPVVATPLVLAFGLPGTLFLAVPAAIMAAALFYEI